MGRFGDRSPWPIGSCCGLIFGPWIFWGINEGPRDFFGFWFLSQFNHPRHLESGVPPPPPSGCNVDTIYITIHQVSHSGYSSHAEIGHQQQLPVTCPLLMLLILLRRNAWAPHVSRLTLQGEETYCREPSSCFPSCWSTTTESIFQGKTVLRQIVDL